MTKEGYVRSRLMLNDKKLHPLLGWSFWAMPNAPSDGATIPLHPLLGWSFPSLSMNILPTTSAN
ncbi:hypothetical protein [Nostoc sp.]|uniref:hypothetical protein n=1 Tax=Nostoc sp. TaxID=1180 RepID=UPI002FF7BE2F